MQNVFVPVFSCAPENFWRPRQDSNLRHRLRRPVLYPLSYGGGSRRDRGHAEGGPTVVPRHAL